MENKIREKLDQVIVAWKKDQVKGMLFDYEAVAKLVKPKVPKFETREEFEDYRDEIIAEAKWEAYAIRNHDARFGPYVPVGEFDDDGVDVVDGRNEEERFAS